MPQEGTKAEQEAAKVIANWRAAYLAVHGDPPSEPIRYRSGWFQIGKKGNVRKYRAPEVRAMTARLRERLQDK